jgi:glycosyltransferase involved in cell wall biosynthesis
MGSPFYSVVIPAYNRDASIASSIESVLNQTYQDLEVIVVDDGSTDKTRDIVEKYSSIDSRVKYFYQENSGGAAARNLGILRSSGQYICFLDSDDVYLKGKLEESKEYLSGDNVVLFTSIIVDRGVGKTWTKPHRGPLQGERISDYLMVNHGFMQTSTVIVQSKLAKITLFTTGLTFGQDTDFALRLEKNNAQFIYLDAPSVVWQDAYSPGRVSNGKDYRPVLSWLDSYKNFVSKSAYYSYKGFHIARLARQNGALVRSYCFYFEALFKGAFSPRVAIISFLQISFSRSFYRKVADVLVRVKGKDFSK